MLTKEQLETFKQAVKPLHVWMRVNDLLGFVTHVTVDSAELLDNVCYVEAEDETPH